jgi:hypothetical protein
MVAAAAGIACAWLLANAALAADAPANWKPLFNGKTLKGWSVHYASKTDANAPAPATLFAVEDGAIHAYPTQAAGSPQPNAYLETDASYKDYVISLEYRWGEKKFAPRMDLVRDAGLIYHVQRERAADWPAGSEAQIQEGDVGDSWAVSSQLSTFVNPKTGKYAAPEDGGVPVTVGHEGKFERTRHNRVNEYPGWNTLEVIVRGDRATHVVNGVINMRVYDIKGWDAATNSWVKVRPGQDRIAGRKCRDLLSQYRVRPLTKADDLPPEPKATEVWFPGAAESDAGRIAGCAAVGCHHPLRRQEPRCVEEHEGRRAGALEHRRRPVGRESGHGRHPEPREVRRRAIARRVVGSEPAGRQGQPGPRQQRHIPAGRLRSAGARQLREQDLRERHGGQHLQAVPAAGECSVACRALADLRHHLHGAAIRGRRIAGSPARLTVLLNGVLVQNNSVLKGGTTYIGAPSYTPHGDLPLRLQDHSHLVRYRNIWLRKL